MMWGAVRWKLRQGYSKIRSSVGGGHFIWTLEPGIRFVVRSDDVFSQLLFICHGHEKLEMQWCRRWIEPGDSLIDCGANIGYFSSYLAQACQLNRILAVEGNERTASICRDSLAVLGVKNVTVIDTVLSASESDKVVILARRGQEPWQRATHVSEETSTGNVATLDSLVERHQISPSLVKIDCEGFEPFILEGARRLLHGNRPAFMVECNDEALRAAQTGRQHLFSIFKENNYALFHLGSFDGQRPFGISCDEHFPAREFNFAAIPNDASALERWRRSSGPLAPSAF